MRVVIAGSGVAGAIIAAGLADLPGLHLLCLERVARGDHALAGNGLNIGPNAVDALEQVLPRIAARLAACSLPWREWHAEGIDGTLLWHLPLAEVAGRDGWRIRWSDLYRECRAAAGPAVRYGREALHAVDARQGVEITTGSEEARERLRADLLVVADGRFSVLRTALGAPPAARHLGVANFRVLLDDARALPLDDLRQWYAGPARLLAFRLRDGLIYLSGNLPLPGPEAEIAETMTRAEALAAAYRPAGYRVDAQAGWLIDAACASVARHHWSRAQQIDPCYRLAGGRAVLVGDAAHAMAPTLGQGATMAIEDACVFVRLFRQAWLADGGVDPAAIAEAFERWRAPRVEFVARASSDATDSLLAGADAAACVRAKGGAAWRERFARLYRAPVPEADAAIAG